MKLPKNANYLALLMLGLPSIAAADFAYNIGGSGMQCHGGTYAGSLLGCSALNSAGARGAVGVEDRPYILLDNTLAYTDPNTGSLNYPGNTYSLDVYGNVRYDFRIGGQPGTTTMVNFVAPFSVAPYKLSVPFGNEAVTAGNIELKVTSNMSFTSGNQLEPEAAFAKLNFSTRQSFGAISPALEFELSLHNVLGFESTLEFKHQPGFGSVTDTSSLLLDGNILGAVPVSIGQDGQGYGSVSLYAGSSGSTVFIDPYLSISKDYLALYPNSTLTFDAGVGNMPIGVSAVPEPGSWALWLGGALALGFLSPRRRSTGEYRA